MSKAKELPAQETRDPVYWAQHYWREQDFEGDEVPFLVFSSLLRYQRRAVTTVEQQLADHNLKLTDYLLLMTLQLSGSGTRLISSLARNLMVHATTATLATDRLEARNLVKRSPHPTDRRAIRITITDEGRELVHAATNSLSSVQFGLSGASSESLEQLGLLLADLRTAAGDTETQR